MDVGPKPSERHQNQDPGGQELEFDGCAHNNLDLVYLSHVPIHLCTLCSTSSLHVYIHIVNTYGSVERGKYG